MGLSNKSSEVSTNDRFVNIYLRAIEHNPANLDNYRQLARMLEVIGEQQQATDYLYKAIQLESDGVTLEAYLNLNLQLGDILFQQERWEEAATIYQRAIQLKPDAFWSHYNLGKVLYNLEQWEKAKQILQKAAQLNKSSAWTIYYLGEIYAHQQDWHQAVDAYRRVLALQPDLPEIHDKLSYALHQLARLSLADARQDYYLEEGRGCQGLARIQAESTKDLSACRQQLANGAYKLVENPQEIDPWNSNPLPIIAPLNASHSNGDLKPKYSEDNRAVKPITETSVFRAKQDKIEDDSQGINSFRKLLLEIDSHTSTYLRLRLLKSRLLLLAFPLLKS